MPHDAQLKQFMREYICDALVKIEEQLKLYNAQDKVNQLEKFKKCHGLVSDPNRHLKYQTLVKLTQYVELVTRHMKRITA